MPNQKDRGDPSRGARICTSICQSPVTATLSPMNQAGWISPCGICGAEGCGEGTVCPECQHAFDSPSGDDAASETSLLDLGKYSSRLFPWEQMTTPPRLISVHPIWLVLALGLVVLVLLLALIRTPLPSCWELS
jgi:hypothetical protein